MAGDCEVFHSRSFAASPNPWCSYGVWWAGCTGLLWKAELAPVWGQHWTGTLSNPKVFPKGNSQNTAFFKRTKSYPKQCQKEKRKQVFLATVRPLVIQLAMDERNPAFQLGVTGKSNSYTPPRAILSFYPMYLKDSIPQQRGHKTAALVGLLISNWSPVFCKHHTWCLN